MDRKKILTLTLLMVAMTACKASSPGPEQGAVGDSSPAQSAPVQTPAVDDGAGQGAASAALATQTLEAKLKKEMAYADLRKAVLADGWLPVKDYACKENVGGEARICKELSELQACSGDGHCVMWFGNGSSQTKLRVDTYGDYRHWNDPARAAELAVRSWEFSAAKPAVQDGAVACPSQDFNEFLKAFAHDDRVQQAFTTPLVKVMQYQEIGEDSETYPTYMNASDYSDFRFDYADDGFHVVDYAGKTDPKPTPLEIKPETSSSYYVSYRYGMSEGNSYRFEKQRGCWYLTQDPDAPIP